MYRRVLLIALILLLTAAGLVWYIMAKKPEEPLWPAIMLAVFMGAGPWLWLVAWNGEPPGAKYD